MKKAVNSEIDGFVEDVELDPDSDPEKSKITITSIFHETEIIEIKKIDGILILEPCLIIQKKSEISIFSKIIDYIQTYRHPEKIFW